MIENEKLLAACDYVLSTDRGNASIGTYKEKTLHAALKQYIEPDDNFQEVAVGSFVADIYNKDGIFEIQTRSFNTMRKKLACFLEREKVTIVYPMPSTKWLLWVDSETGEATKQRKSPKIGKPYEAFYELYKIKPFLTHPNLQLRIVLLNIKEFRYLDGWSKDKKKGSTRCERIPTEIVEEIQINCLTDYKKLIPEELPAVFYSKDYAKATGLNKSLASTAVHVLYSVGVIKRLKKDKKGYSYERTE